MTVTWRRQGPEAVSAADALTHGVTLLETVRRDDPAMLAWWRVDAEALVLGRGSRVEADEDACAAAGVAVVRRSSGGGPVLWGPDLLALDVIVPRGHSWWQADVVASYRRLGEAFASALNGLGVAAHPLTPAQARGRADETGQLACYASFSPWEVVAGDRKLVGLSQVRRRAGILVQAGVLLHLDPPRLPSLLALDATARTHLATELGLRAAGLDDVAPGVTADEVVTALDAVLAR